MEKRCSRPPRARMLGRPAGSESPAEASMSTTKIAIVSLGVVSLISAGLYSWQPGLDQEPPAARVVAGRGPQPGSARSDPPRPATAVFPAYTPPQPLGSHGAADIRQGPVDSDLEEALATARQDTDPQRRIEALRFLGEHAAQTHLDALQQIQARDPVPEVRRAAEAAVHLLMARFTGQPWPELPSTGRPHDYMRALSPPGAP